MKLQSERGYMEWGTAGQLRVIGLNGEITPLLTGEAPLMEVALPLPDYPAHRARPAVMRVGGEPAGEGVSISAAVVASPVGQFPVRTEVECRALPGGSFALRARVTNESAETIVQVFFPNLEGLRPTGPAGEEALRLGRNRKLLRPYTDLVITDQAASFLDLYRKTYFEYGGFDFCMKWFDLGNDQRGLTVYSHDVSADAQGLYVEKERDAERVRVAWAHYPYIAPGESWESPEFVLLPHEGNWQVGALPYREFVKQALPPAPSSPYLDGALGLRTVWSSYAYRGRRPIRFCDLPAVAADAVRHGARDISVWGWCEDYMELPYRLRPELGSEMDLRQAIEQCKALGANLSPFISVRAISPRKAPDEWLEHDAQGYPRLQSWSYHPDFVPVFNPPFSDSYVSAMVCGASAGWREAYLAGAAQLADWGFGSAGFDQTFVISCCFNKAHDHKPQQTGGAFHATLQEGIEIGRRADPDGTFSGEFFGDVLQTYQQYTWDWFTMNPEVAAPFRFVFPRYRIGFLVDRSLRWLIEGFTHGMFLNFFPEGGHGMIGTDEVFSRHVQALAVLRRQYAPFFERGEYYGSAPVVWAGTGRPAGDSSGLSVGALYDGADRPDATSFKAPVAALYAHGDELLLIVANPHAEPVTAACSIDLIATGRREKAWRVWEHDGQEGSAAGGEAFAFSRTLAPHQLALLRFTPERVQ